MAGLLQLIAAPLDRLADFRQQEQLIGKYSQGPAVNHGCRIDGAHGVYPRVYTPWEVRLGV